MGALLIAGGLSMSCAAADPVEGTGGATGGAGGTSASTSGTAGAGGAGASGGAGGVGGGIAPDRCLPFDSSGVRPCADKAPPAAFEPAVQWVLPPETGHIVIPLVGNFTDDDGNGSIDVCDMPDIITVDFSGQMELFAGDSGISELVFQAQVENFATPAFADIDGDGLPEVVAIELGNQHLVAFEHDGTVKWKGDDAASVAAKYGCGTIAIHDLDGDGSVEIIVGYEVFDAQGKWLWGAPGLGMDVAPAEIYCQTQTAADLDGDGKLELLFGNVTLRWDGSVFWELPDLIAAHPHVANLDDDPEPEVLLASGDGISVVEADGTLKFGPVRPTGEPPAANCWGKPSAIHDFDGDGHPEVAISSCTTFGVYEITDTDLVPNWVATVVDDSGLCSSTAFDFLGDGTAEAIYGDEENVYVFEGMTGEVLMTVPRSSGTLVEYPVVADVDNDGSAEILVVGNYPTSLMVIRDVQDRWIQARRIWSQHSSSVTHIREDSTVPKTPLPSWQVLNTFRSNAQIEGNKVCNPDPPR